MKVTKAKLKQIIKEELDELKAAIESDDIKEVADAVSIPVIAHGGAGKIEDIKKVVKESNASAVALGSMVVFQKQGMGVLVNFPNLDMLNLKI